MITLKEPITNVRQVPTVSLTPVSDVFTGLWITNLIIRSSPTGTTEVTAEFTPFDPATGIMCVRDRRVLHIEDLFAYVTQHPEFSSIGAFIDTCGALAAAHGLTEATNPGFVRVGALPAPTAPIP